MSEENKNEDVAPVAAENNDAVVSEESTIDHTPLIEKYEEAVAEQQAKLDAPENVISSGAGSAPAAEEVAVQAMTAVENGVIGTGTVIKKAKASSKKQETKPEKVAIFSTKNVSWSSVGKVYRGYNLVTPEQAEKWLTRNHIRTVTPEELAKARENNK